MSDQVALRVRSAIAELRSALVEWDECRSNRHPDDSREFVSFRLLELADELDALRRRWRRLGSVAEMLGMTPRPPPR